MNNDSSGQNILQYLNETSLDYRFHFFDSVTSTNDVAKELILRDNSENSIILAGDQSAGRGRKGRSFHSPPGGIYISFVFAQKHIRNPLPFQLFAPSVAVCLTIERLLGNCPTIKWSNDILLQDKKICGILTETQHVGDDRKIIIGIGINYSTSLDSLPADIREKTGTLREYTKKIPRDKFTANLINTLDELTSHSEENVFLTEYKSRADLIGNYITVTGNREELTAKAVDVCADGSLLIENESGERRNIYAGDVSVRKDIKK